MRIRVTLPRRDMESPGGHVSDSAAVLWSSLNVRPVREPPDLDEIFVRYLDPVYRFLYSRVGNREDAEDLTSEVFLKAAKQLDRSRPEMSVASWLFTVARTVLADHWRRYYRGGAELPLDDSRIESMQSLGSPTLSAETTDLLKRVLDALPDRYRQVLELRFLRGYSIQDVARELEITPENVKVIQHRALAKAVQAGEGLLP